jgi:hypothetical protein
MKNLAATAVGAVVVAVGTIASPLQQQRIFRPLRQPMSRNLQPLRRSLLTSQRQPLCQSLRHLPIQPHLPILVQQNRSRHREIRANVQVNCFFELRSAIVAGLKLASYGMLAAVGSFPAAFTAVYVVGAIAAFGIGFLALKKSREVNAAIFDQEIEDEIRKKG